MVQTKISPNSNDQLAKQTTLARTEQDNMGWTQARNFWIKKKHSMRKTKMKEDQISKNS